MSNEVAKEDKTVYVTEQDPAAEYVTIAEYIRKRHEKDLEKDPMSRPLWANSINKVIQDGFIEVFIQGKNKFIDWNKYKNWVFKRSFQMPISKTKEGTQESVTVRNTYKCAECQNAFSGTFTKKWQAKPSENVMAAKTLYAEALMKKEKRCPNCRTIVKPA